MKCIACAYEMPEGRNQCPRCNCWQYKLNNTPEEIAALNLLANSHRATFLQDFDFGIAVYSWKDRDGDIVADGQTRQSFGAGSGLLNRKVWLDQEFASAPGTREVTVQCSVYRAGSAYSTIAVRIPIPVGQGPMRLGMEVHDDLTVSMYLKKEMGETRSQPQDYLIVM